ncbi:serine/threonine protein kinase [Actinomadura graeca]|uniref:Serine/threonine protein kinase n=1 Tax=Actinomadura graeca TaxID=2750812 RepID=A0ABX8QZL2_9ACTN|nr:lipopolysaccharide kinase InaA family protein [Actinomadura graeca]QXJ22223.1 serine/threonine protein kinase [Actinomadura graeca]
MRHGDVVQGYRIVSEPTNEGGGKCVWAFAERAGRECFIKRFLEPKRPREGGGGSEASRRARLRECAEFEDRHRAIMDRLHPRAAGGGNLVLATDFFHERSSYYKVTERIDAVPGVRPHALDRRHRAVLLRTLALSLRLLHGLGIVHGDLKPANVLVQRRAANTFHTAKLIDFDDAYFSGSPPAPAVIAGDSLYGAPEWLRYLREDGDTSPAELTTSADVFSLGLMAHLYLTGSLPAYDTGRYASPAEAVDADGPLRVDDRLAPEMRGLIEAMTAADPGRRPAARAFVEALADPGTCRLDREEDGAPPRSSSRIRSKIDGPGGAAPSGP